MRSIQPVWATALAGVAIALPAAAQPVQPAAPVFVQPDVSDPMLAPPTAAPAEVPSWDDALARLRRSPGFLTSVAAVERALAQRRIALAAVLPMLVGTGAYLHNFNTVDVPFGGAVLVVPPPTVWSATATANWNVISLRGLYGIGSADLATDVAKLSLADRRRVLANSVVAAMLATIAAQRVAELERVGLRAALERLALTQTRLSFSRGTELDVDRANQDVAAARALVISGDESLRQSRESFGQALGSPTPLSAPADLDLDELQAAIANTCRLDSDLERRADVVAARKSVAFAERQIVDAKLQYAPTIALQSQAGYATAVTFGPLATWTIAATLTVPFYDGGVRTGAIRDARAAADQANDALTALRIEAAIEMARAARAIAVDTAARDIAKQQRDLSARIDGRTRAGYASGIGTSLDLVTSAQALRQAEINLVLLDLQLAQARADAILVNAECVY